MTDQERGVYNGKPYDYALANAAAAVDQCVKLGGVILPVRQTGFRHPDPAPQPRSAGQGSGSA